MALSHDPSQPSGVKAMQLDCYATAVAQQAEGGGQGDRVPQRLLTGKRQGKREKGEN